MSSEFSSILINDENESTIESKKTKRLPRSAKKRLRYERIRQQRKQASKKKKNHKSSTIIIPSNSSEILTDQVPLITGSKIFKREANERLAEINRNSSASMICIDCAYNESMSGKEIASLARQIGRCYSSNRRATNPVRLILTNWSNDSSLARECRRVNNGFDNYQIILDNKPIYESYPSEHLIYLSPNADKILTEFNEQNIYVIGGLVDESVRKNMTYQICHDRNINCYKLPIEIYMEHSINGGTFNQILAVNQVFDILLTFIIDKNWEQALKKNVPERKGWVIKKSKDSNDNKTEFI